MLQYIYIIMQYFTIILIEDFIYKLLFFENVLELTFTLYYYFIRTYILFGIFGGTFYIFWGVIGDSA